MRAPGGMPPEGSAAKRRARAVIAAAVLLGLALRLAFALGYWTSKPLTIDEQEYLLLASSVAQGAGFTYPESRASEPARHFERPPAFAVFLAGILALTRDPLVSAPVDEGGLPRGFPASSTHVPAAVKVGQSLIGVAVIALIALLAWVAAGPGAAAVAAVVAAVYPPLACSSGYVTSEPLYSALALAAAWLLQRGVAARTRVLPALAAAGLTAGIALLTREAMIFFLPLAGLWLLARRGLVPAIVFVLGVMVVLGPWIARNYGVYGRFVLTAPHGGITFWTGNNAAATGEGDLAANPDMARTRVAFEKVHAGATPGDLDAAYYHDALQFIAQHPFAWCVLLAKKLFYTFVPVGPSYRVHSGLYYATTGGTYVLLLPFAVLGLVGLLRRGLGGRMTALWLLGLSSVVMCIVFFPQERFRFPVLDPVVIVCAAAWVASLGRVGRWFPESRAAQGLV